MPAGFSYINPDSGYQSIDQNYKNWALRAKGTANSQYDFGSVLTGAFTVAGSPAAMLAYRGDFPTAIRYIRGNAGAYEFSWASYTTAATATIDWWLFDDPAYAIVDPEKVGLQVFTANGAVAFDSRMRYMQVIKTIAGTISSAQNDPAVTFIEQCPAGTQPALIVGNKWGSRYSVPFWPPDWVHHLRLLFADVSGTAINFASHDYQIAISPSASPQYSSDNYSFTVIDTSML